ncbi:MAG TPA: hypothetical protein VHV80_01000 [Steroidobacteraceae bacterium]|jgi:hypothetical protein|nr:hypothetical protein [Steroidobacteraceae bacterium]
MIRALIIGFLSAGALGACSSTPSHRVNRTAAAIAPGWCSTADGKALRPGSNGCDPLTRRYSGEQLQRTGRIDAAHALQMLDPSITVRGPP